LISIAGTATTSRYYGDEDTAASLAAVDDDSKWGRTDSK
jgi:hypothetical protein